MHKKIFLSICIVLFGTLISCSNWKSETLKSPPASRTSDLSLTQQPITVDTTGTPTQITFQFPFYGTPDKFDEIYNTSKQITDGNLLLRINQGNETCYKRGERTQLEDGELFYTSGDIVSIVVTFDNLTDESLTIANYDVVEFASIPAIGYLGKLTPILTTLDGQRITTTEEAQSLGYREYPTPSSISSWELYSEPHCQDHKSTKLRWKNRSSD